MPYTASRGGHAPGHLRNALNEWIDEGAEGDTVTIDDEARPLKWLLGQLWNCSDILPGSDCDALNLPTGSTYAIAARKLVAEEDE